MLPRDASTVLKLWLCACNVHLILVLKKMNSFKLKTVPITWDLASESQINVARPDAYFIAFVLFFFEN